MLKLLHPTGRTFFHFASASRNVPGESENAHPENVRRTALFRICEIVDLIHHEQINAFGVFMV
jgi:hypothetical protein